MEENVLIVVSTIIIGLIATAIKSGFVSFIADKTKKILEYLLHKEFDGKKIEFEVDEVKSRLYEIKALTNADRVTVNRFHNGTTFLPNQPAWKVSRVYEICSSGVSYEANNVQNVMAMLIWDSIGAIFDTKGKTQNYVERYKGDTCNNCRCIYKYDVSKMSESYGKVLLRNQGIETFIQIPIYSKDKIIGYIGIDYLDKHDENIDFCVICQKVSEIGFILDR